MKDLTRREFIARSSMLLGGTLGGMALTGDVIFPREAGATKVDFAESSCGPGENRGRKILVAYASLCGSTGGVADAIGRVFCDQGARVDVRLIKNAGDVKEYDGVVIGSAVRSSSWYPEAIEFVEGNKEALSRIPVAHFLTCLALYRDNEGTRREARSYMNPVLKAVPEVKPVDMGLFAGTLDYGRMNMIYRMVMKSKMKKKGVPEGDFRNWKAIEAWAGGLSQHFI